MGIFTDMPHEKCQFILEENNPEIESIVGGEFCSNLNLTQSFAVLDKKVDTKKEFTLFPEATLEELDGGYVLNNENLTSYIVKYDRNFEQIKSVKKETAGKPYKILKNCLIFKNLSQDYIDNIVSQAK